MSQIRFPVIDMAATGANIARLRQERGLTVRDLQQFFGFEEPQAIYKWQRGKSLFRVPMNEILVSSSPYIYLPERQAEPCGSFFLGRAQWAWQNFRTTRPLSANLSSHSSPGGEQIRV